MFRRTFVAVCAALMLSLTGCGGDSPTGSDNSIVGTYTLRTVGGETLPATLFQAGADRLEITAGSINLNRDNTFSGSVTLRETESGTVTTQTEPLSGTYTRNNNALVFNFTDGEQVSGSISGNDLTLTSDGIVFLFRR